MRITKSQLKQINEIALTVRLKMEACKPSELGLYWAKFPKGACGDACLVLGPILHDAGFEKPEYICGTKYRSDDTPYTHAWLHYKGLIIDITADQFSEIKEKVIVTTDSEWHRQWSEDQPTPAHEIWRTSCLWKLYSFVIEKTGRT